MEAHQSQQIATHDFAQELEGCHLQRNEIDITHDVQFMDNIVYYITPFFMSKNSRITTCTLYYNF